MNELPVYCHMTTDLGACKGGGWTLVMKIDGRKVITRKQYEYKQLMRGTHDVTDLASVLSDN